MATNLYETDFVAWTQEQAAELRRLRDARINTRLDLDLLAEEVEDLGSELRFAVRSHVARIIEHLLKIEYSPAHEPRHGWRRSVRNARDEVEQRMTPTVRRDVEKQLSKLFEKARRNVADSLEAYREYDALDALPTLNPYSLDEILDPDFWPPEPQAPR
jgi:hypothetical protein